MSCRRLLAFLFFCLISRLAFAATAPGGFLENDETATPRALMTQAQASAILPERGAFDFPAPYGTRGVRVTNASDCGGQDCVDMIYSYWRNMSNSAGSNTLYVFIGLDRNRGGQGPTLFSYDKTSEALTQVGPLFPASSPYSWNSAEGWYFSYGMATKIYLPSGSKLLRYDVLSHAMETVFDSTTQYPNTVIRQANSSNDDDVHSATLQDASSRQTLGCIAYKSSTRQFFYYPAQGKFDECQIDKSGRYLLIKEKLPTDTCTSCDEDNVFVDLQTGVQQVLMDQSGAGGHSDMGYGTYLAVDNWNNYANAWRTWNLGQTTLAGGLTYHDNDWSAFSPSHVSFENASPDLPIAQQYACGSGASRSTALRANEVICFMLDSSVPHASAQVLVVAPVMTSLDATGGNATCPSCTDYGKDPKGNIDPTGQYFFWVSNMGGSRMDAFMVRIPSQLLTGTGSSGDSTAPSIGLTAPYAGAALSGSVNVSANASDNVAVAGVQFKLDGANLGAELTQTPYTLTWDTTKVAAGTHTLSAVARDAAGNVSTAGNVTVTTFIYVPPPVISSVSASVTGSSSVTLSWSTDQPANSQVAYGTTTAYGSTSVLDTALATAHALVLTGLVPGTLYHYQVISRDSTGQASVSADQVFTTQAGATVTLPAVLADWRLDAGNGLQAVDSSGHGYSATLHNQPSWGLGVAGDGLSFDGIDQYASVTSSSALNAYPLTVSAWFKAGSDTGQHGIVSKYAYGSMRGYQVLMSGGKLCAWYYRDSADHVGNTACSLRAAGYADGTWHMVTFTVNVYGGKLYVDGALKSKLGWTGRPGAASTSQALNFARYPGASRPYLAATLDEVRLYAKALSAAQVAALYASFPREQPTAWTDLRNVTTDGGSLQKTAGCDGCEDASAASQQQLAQGSDGHLQFTVAETNTLRSVGLAAVGSGPGVANMDYALRLQNGIAEVREKGLYRKDVTFASGDVFRLELRAGSVDYYKNGILFYTSTVAASQPLQAAASVNTLGGTISDALIQGQ
ncbi:MAG TPA: LamG-like jellyroll fold domain-containing protein [Gammaproteobacteria bacterium]